MQTMQFEFIEPLQLMILVHGEPAPSDPEWEAYVAALLRMFHERRLRRILVFTDGSGPNGSQREQLRYDPARRRVRTAVVTPTLLARGIVTALSWFVDVRAFSPVQLNGAFAYLGIATTDWLSVRKAVATLRMRLFDTPDNPFDMTETIGTLDELVTERLPRLRERVRRIRDT